MTATQIPDAARSTLHAIRDCLADIRARASDMEALPDMEKVTELPGELVGRVDGRKLGEIPGQLMDRAKGRQRRRPSWPWVALSAVAVVGLVTALAMLVLNRTALEPMNEFDFGEAEPHEAAGWTAVMASGARGRPAELDLDGTFPASDPMPSPMSPGIGG